MSAYFTHSISLVLFPVLTPLIAMRLHQSGLMPALQQFLRVVARKYFRERNFSVISGFAIGDFQIGISI